MLALLPFVIALFVLIPAPAEACNCAGGSYNDIWTAEGDVPANQGGFVWERGDDYGSGAPQMQLERQVAGQWEPVADFEVETIERSAAWPAVFVRVPGFENEVGTLYRVLTSVDDGPYEELQQITVTEPVAADQALDLVVGEVERRNVVISPGDSCGDSEESQVVDLNVDLGDLEVHRDLLWFETLVDGEPVHFRESSCSFATPGRSWRGRGIDEVVSPCDVAYATRHGFLTGVLELSMRVSLPGTSLEWTTSAVEVDLTCANAEGDLDTSEEPDVGLPAADAGALPADEEGGCSTAAGSSPWVIFVAFALAAGRRARRHR